MLESHSTVSNVVRRICCVVCDSMGPTLIRFPKTKEEVKEKRKSSLMFGNSQSVWEQWMELALTLGKKVSLKLRFT